MTTKQLLRIRALLLPLLLLSCLVQARPPKVAPLPSWATRLPAPYAATHLDAEAENGYADLVYEKQVHLESQSTYHRRALKILTEAGVQNASEVSVSYDPSYEQLLLHEIHLIRNGARLDRLQPARIKTVQQEQDLNRFLYNGTLSAILILDDVRKGDVIEYSYTRKGFNPVMQGKYADIFETRFTVPVYQMLYKLVAPAGRPLQVRNSLTDLQPQVTDAGGQRSYTWTSQDVPALPGVEGAPSWYDPYPMVMVSEYRNWNEVSKWSEALFQQPATLSAGLRQQIEALRKTHPDEEGRILAAIRFVQDEVRYMGIEMGEHSHKPHHPDQVFAQRFGDCKDKTFLLCTLLRGLGIGARPVLLNTEYKKSLRNWLPSPFAFDHVTVQIHTGGKYVYVDTTRSFQRGRLADISFPDYQVGLVVSDTTSGLTTIPLQDAGKVAVTEVFDVPGMDGRAYLRVTTRYTGSFADDARSEYSSTSLTQIRKNYTVYYRHYFSDLTSDSLQYRDDPATGTFTTVEFYTIPEFWGKQRHFKKASLAPFVINGVLKDGPEGKPHAPMAVTFPARYDEEIIVNLPEDWQIKESHDHAGAAAFNFTANYACDRRTVRLQYSLVQHKDHVSPEEMMAYRAAIAELNEWSGYEISSSDAGLPSADTVSLMDGNYYTLYFLLGLCVVITYLLKRR